MTKHISGGFGSLEQRMLMVMEVRRGQISSASASQHSAQITDASVPHDFSAGILSPSLHDLAKGLLEDAARYRALGRHGDALKFASRAATAGRSSDLGIYCRAIVAVAAAWDALGDRKTALEVLEAGWSHTTTFLDRAVSDLDAPRRLLEVLGAACSASGNQVRAELCFEDAKFLFGSKSSTQADSSVTLGVRALLEGDVDLAGEFFAAVMYEASCRVDLPVRTMALAEVGRGIVLWIKGYDDGLVHIASGMNRARLDGTVERECREFALSVLEQLHLLGNEKYPGFLDEVLYAVK